MKRAAKFCATKRAWEVPKKKPGVGYSNTGLKVGAWPRGLLAIETAVCNTASKERGRFSGACVEKVRIVVKGFLPADFMAPMRGGLVCGCG
jgi:hypothetical protein